MATINSNGKVAYIYNQADDTWYALGGAVNTNAEYTWTADQTFNATVDAKSVMHARAGLNNFQNFSARDAIMDNPTNGIVVFIRQDNSGNVINQLQYYHNGVWRNYNDSASLLTKTADYTLQLSDAGQTIRMTSSSDTVVTVPANSSQAFINGQKIEIIRNGSGNVSIAGAIGVTINSKNGNKKIAAQYSGAVLMKDDTNTWILIGDLTA